MRFRDTASTYFRNIYSKRYRIYVIHAWDRIYNICWFLEREIAVGQVGKHLNGSAQETKGCTLGGWGMKVDFKFADRLSFLGLILTLITCRNFHCVGQNLNS